MHGRNGDTMGRPASSISSAAASPSPTGTCDCPVPVGVRPIPKAPTIRQLEQRAAHGDRQAELMLDAWADAKDHR